VKNGLLDKLLVKQQLVNKHWRAWVPVSGEHHLHRVRRWGWYPSENRQGSIHLPTSSKNMVKPLHQPRHQTSAVHVHSHPNCAARLWDLEEHIQHTAETRRFPPEVSSHYSGNIVAWPHFQRRSPAKSWSGKLIRDSTTKEAEICGSHLTSAWKQTSLQGHELVTWQRQTQTRKTNEDLEGNI